MPEWDADVSALVDLYYDQVRAAGEQGRRFDPMVDLTAPAQGQVLWADGPQNLEGIEVTKWDPGMAGSGASDSMPP